MDKSTIVKNDLNTIDELGFGDQGYDESIQPDQYIIDDAIRWPFCGTSAFFTVFVPIALTLSLIATRQHFNKNN